MSGPGDDDLRRSALPETREVSSRPALGSALSALARRAPAAARFGLKLVAGAALVFALALSVLLIALWRGPIALDPLTPSIIRALDESSGGRFAFALGSAALKNGEHGPTLEVANLSVKTAGKTILFAPRAALSIDFRSLLTGRARLRRLEALDLQLRLFVQPDGAVAVSAGSETVAAPVAIAPPTVESDRPEARPHAPLLRQAGQALRAFMDLATSPDSVLGSVDRLGVSHGRLIVDDRTTDRVIEYDDLALSLDKSRGGMRFTLAGTGGGRRWSLSSIAGGAPGGRRNLDVALRDLSIDEIALAGGLRNVKFDSDAALSLNFHVALSSGNRIDEARGGFRVGSGFFRLDEPDHEPVLIQTIRGALAWDAAQRRFTLDAFEMKAAGYDLAMKGSATPARLQSSGGGVEDLAANPTDAWTVDMHLARPALAAPDRPNGKTVRIDKLDCALRLLPNDKKIVIDDVSALGPEIDFGYRATVDFVRGPHLVYELRLLNSQIPAVVRLWPTHVGGGARAWLIDHATAGVIRRLTLRADFDEAAFVAMRYEQPPPDESAQGEGEIENATIFQAIPGLPSVTGVSGTLRTSGRAARFVATAGEIDAGRGGKLKLSSGVFSVPDEAVKPPLATLDLRLAGSVEAAAEIIAVPAIAAYASLPVEASALKGSIEGRVQIPFELGAQTHNERLSPAIEATTANLSIDHFIGAERLENASLTINSDRAGLTVGGSGRLYGAPVSLDIRRPRGEKGVGQANLTLVFDDAARAKAGFVLPGVSGPMSVLFKTQGELSDNGAQVEVDLLKTSIDSPLPSLSKPAGKAGRASFTIARRSEGVTLEQLQFETGTAKIAGVVDLAKDGAFRAARLSQMRLSPGDDARVDLSRAGDLTKISVRGVNIDARPMMRSLTQNSRERAPPTGGQSRASMSFDDVDLDLKSPIVTGHGKQILANVDLRLERRGGRLRALQFTGKFGREPVTAILERGQGVPTIEIATSDGGSLLSFFDFYHKMDSGTLNATVQLGQDRADGALRVRDFYLKGEPTMRQLMSQGAVRSDSSGGWRFDPESVRVARLQSGFGWTNGRLTLRDGVMSGPEMGLTFDGTLDFSRERVDIGGAYVPAYALNNLLSNIPLLGEVLGGRHEGVFAINYRVTGDASSPTISVNPLSALAPGMIRKIMGIVDGSTKMQDGWSR